MNEYDSKLSNRDSLQSLQPILCYICQFAMQLGLLLSSSCFLLRYFHFHLCFLVLHDHFCSSVVLIIEFIILVILYASIYYVWFFYSLITYNHSQNIWDAPIFIWNSLLREKFNIYFSRAFGCIEKNFTNLGIFLIFPNFLRS